MLTITLRPKGPVSLRHDTSSEICIQRRVSYAGILVQTTVDGFFQSGGSSMPVSASIVDFAVYEKEDAYGAGNRAAAAQRKADNLLFPELRLMMTLRLFGADSRAVKSREWHAVPLKLKFGPSADAEANVQTALSFPTAASLNRDLINDFSL